MIVGFVFVTYFLIYLATICGFAVKTRPDTVEGIAIVIGSLFWPILLPLLGLGWLVVRIGQL